MSQDYSEGDVLSLIIRVVFFIVSYFAFSDIMVIYEWGFSETKEVIEFNRWISIQTAIGES